MRTTKGNVESAFKYFIQAIGGRVANRYDDHGGFVLDHGIGGYIIEQICSNSSGVNQPFGSQRMKAEAFYDACWLAIRAIELKEKESKKETVCD
jgi:hypothetical protein